MGMGQWYKDKQGFKWTEITEEEENALQQELRKKNKVIYVECLEDAEEIIDAFGRLDIEVVANALFDKRATQFFTLQKSFLDDKCRKLKEGPENYSTSAR